MITLEVITGTGRDLPRCEHCRSRARWQLVAPAHAFDGVLCNGCLIGLLRDIWHEASGGTLGPTGLPLDELLAGEATR